MSGLKWLKRLLSQMKIKSFFYIIYQQKGLSHRGGPFCCGTVKVPEFIKLPLSTEAVGFVPR